MFDKAAALRNQVKLTSSRKESPMLIDERSGTSEQNLGLLNSQEIYFKKIAN